MLYNVESPAVRQGVRDFRLNHYFLFYGKGGGGILKGFSLLARAFCDPSWGWA
jgi:hypothetical protein